MAGNGVCNYVESSGGRDTPCKDLAREIIES